MLQSIDKLYQFLFIFVHKFNYIYELIYLVISIIIVVVVLLLLLLLLGDLPWLSAVLTWNGILMVCWIRYGNIYV